ncbi:hypothetical protein BRADI_5g20472v3, partial [Brachypodium distachyon]
EDDGGSICVPRRQGFHGAGAGREAHGHLAAVDGGREDRGRDLQAADDRTPRAENGPGHGRARGTGGRHGGGDAARRAAPPTQPRPRRHLRGALAIPRRRPALRVRAAVPPPDPRHRRLRHRRLRIPRWPCPGVRPHRQHVQRRHTPRAPRILGRGAGASFLFPPQVRFAG